MPQKKKSTDSGKNRYTEISERYNRYLAEIKKGDISALFEFGEAMRKDGLFSDKYYEDLCKEYGYPKMTEDDSKTIKRLSTILEYRILYEEHYYDEFCRMSETDLSEKEKYRIAIDKAKSYLKFHLSFYFDEEYKEHGMGYDKLKTLILNLKRNDIKERIINKVQDYGIDPEEFLADICARAKTKFDNHEFIAEAGRSISQIINARGVTKPNESLEDILKSYNNLKKIKDLNEYDSNAKQFISKLNELDWGDYIRVMETQMFVKRAQYWTEKLDEKFAPDLIKKNYVDFDEYKSGMSKENSVTKNFIYNELEEAIGQLDDLFYLKGDKSTTERELYKRSNKLVDYITTLKKVMEISRKKSDEKYEKIVNNIEKNLNSALKSMVYFINEDIKCY